MEDQLSYQNFWSKIAAHPDLQGITKIYFSPDGVYNQINLNSLFNPDSRKFVIDELLIHTVTNTRDVLTIKEAREDVTILKTGTSLLVGFPDYYYIFDQDGDGHPDLSAVSLQKEEPSTRDAIGSLSNSKISDLPGTKREIESVSDIFKKYNQPVNVYLGVEAFENTLKARELFFKPPIILHVATHGFFRQNDASRSVKEILRIEAPADSSDFSTIGFNEQETNPLMRSGILLASAGHAYRNETLLNEVNAILKEKKYEDGVLSAYEALNLNLTGTELVVLSACETGLGELKNGEGVYGLQRSLQTAGAKSVVMSLWKVDDEATGKFMIYFYDLWFKTGNKRESFRNAQLKIRNEFPNPFYWGAFVMIGQ